MLINELIGSRISVYWSFMILVSMATQQNFANCYRQSVKKRTASAWLVPTAGGRVHGQALTLAHAPSLANTITRSRRFSTKHMMQEGRVATAVPRRITENILLPAVSEISLPPPTPKTPKFSPHNLFELDDVSLVVGELQLQKFLCPLNKLINSVSLLFTTDNCCLFISSGV